MTSAAQAQEWLNQAIEHHRNGRLGEAEGLYRRVLGVAPQSADAWYLLGVIADETGRPAASLQLIDEALRIRPDNGQYHYSRGIALQKLERPGDAVAAYRNSLQRNPDHLQAMENMAVALADIGDDEQGEAICRKVLGLAPASPIAHRNLATLLLNRGSRESALGHIEKVLAQDPADASARAKRAQILLALGRFEAGYADYAWRQHSPDFSGPSPPKLMPLPSLGAEEIRGRKLVILPEQGVGDEILFASGVPAVLAEASKVLLFADPRLIPLYRRSFPKLDVRPALPADRCRWPEGVDASWRRCEAGDLPRMAFGDADPVPARYLRPDPERVRYWRDRLCELPGRRVGIAWRGGADARATRARSLSLTDLIPLLQLPDTSFVNLQYARPDYDLSAEISDFNAAASDRSPVIELDGLDTMNDLDELAAVSVALDFVVTIDSAIAHLAAAAGAKTCVLLPPGGDWRWFDARTDSPWYVSARTWRRDPGQNWAGAVDQLARWLSRDGAPGDGDGMLDEPLPPPEPAKSESVKNEGPANPAEPRRSETILLLNDTSAWYHWGCSCTSIALNEGLRTNRATVNSCALLRDVPADALPDTVDAFDDDAVYKRFRRAYGWLIDAIKDADRVVVNGEGTLHGVGEQARGLLYLAWIAAARLDRPVQVLNHSVYPLDTAPADEGAAVAIYRRVYERVQKVVVREPVSHAVIEALGLSSTLGFDCLPLFAERHGPPAGDLESRDRHVVVAGSVLLTPARIAVLANQIDELAAAGYRTTVLLGARGFPAADDARFAAALYATAARKPEMILARSEYEWLSHIGNACLLISGRFHHSIAATCMRTPFVVMGSNTPKITGLMQVLSQQSANPDGFQVVEDSEKALRAAVGSRLATPREFVLDDTGLRNLRELAEENF